MSNGPTTTYERPVNARLIVRLDNGEDWEATDADLVKFGLVKRLDAYALFDETLDRVLRNADLLTGDLTDAQLNPLRHLVETVLMYPRLLDHPDNESWKSVVQLEKRLQAITEKAPR